MPGGEIEPRGCHDVNGFRHFLWTHAPFEKRALRIELREALAQHSFEIALAQEGLVQTRIHRDDMPGGEIKPRGCHDVNGFRDFLWTHTSLKKRALRIELSEALAQHIFEISLAQEGLV